MKVLNRSAALILSALFVLAPLATSAQQQQSPSNTRQTSQGDIPSKPTDLKYPTLEFNPPERAKYRHVLASGAVAYLVEDHDLPLINVQALVRNGEYLEPAGKDGVAALTGSQMRAGGTTSKPAEQFDEAADFLAAQISSSIGPTQGATSL